MDMINILKTVTDLPSDTQLVAMDTQNLFHNVDHQGGLNALTQVLDRRPPESVPSTQRLRDLAEIAFSKSFCMFGKPTSWVPKCLRNFSSLYVAWFENDFVFST